MRQKSDAQADRKRSTMIKLVNVSKTYTTGKNVYVEAFREVNLTFGNSGLCFIVGKSGSGKSTLLNLLGGIDGATLKNAILNSSAPEENKAGAQKLYDFLEYARSFTGSREAVSSASCDPLVQSVCRVLDKAGVAYDTEIGRSECKINVGIRDPDNKESFVLGIVIDDPNRADFDSVREYTRLTEQILSEKYGWRLYRIFPASWFNDFENEKSFC